MHFPQAVEVIEVGPRDGLQNEPNFVPTMLKKELIRKLQTAGFTRIETASFVHPKIVPQMADAKEIAAFCQELGLTYIALTPNMHALQLAIEAGVPQIAVFVGASETFNVKNVKNSVDKTLAECGQMLQLAKQHRLFARGYVSTAFSCPYEGAVSYEQVRRVVAHFAHHGVDEVAIGDTNGQANPQIVYKRCAQLKNDFPKTEFVAHFHDTNGFAYANMIAAMQAGVTKFDSAVAGLGGCPFSPGSTGNVATEKVVELFEEMGIHTGIQREQLKDAVCFVQNNIKRDA